MKRTFLLVFLPAFFCSHSAFSQAFNISEGNWSDPLIWNGGALPSSSDHVVLYHNIVVDINVSCQSLTANGFSVTVNSGVQLQLLAPPVVPGSQLRIWNSSSHDPVSFLQANQKRLAFVAYKNSGTPSGIYEYFVADENETVYKLQTVAEIPYGLSPSRSTICLKPQGDLIAIHRTADSIVIYLNRGHTNYWQSIRRFPLSGFWLEFTDNGNAAVTLVSTNSGRLVMLSPSKYAISDDDGLVWTQSNLPPGFQNQPTLSSTLTSFGNRQFITGSGNLLYSDNNFTNATSVTLPPEVSFPERLIKLSDSRLVLQGGLAGLNSGYFQSLNNGVNWLAISFPIPYDSIHSVNKTYFATPGGNTLRVRGEYLPCNSYFTIDISPGQSQFSFYHRDPYCPGYSIPEYYTRSCQREDGRIYYASFYNGSFSIASVYRDY